MTQQTEESDILKKGTLVNLSVSIWGSTTKIRGENILNTDAEAKLIDNTKHKIDEKWLAPLKRHRSRARDYLYSKAYTFPIPGFTFVPKENIMVIDAAMQRFADGFSELVDQFAVHYPDYREEMRMRLKSLYNPLDYPQDIRNHFAFSWRFLSLQHEDDAGILSQETIRREAQRFREMVDEFKNTAMTTLRTTFAEMVDRTVERLSGEKKVFRDTRIENIRKFISEFSTMNIGDDAELSAVVERCNKILEGVSADAIRSNDEFRHRIASSMQTVQTQLSAMMIGAPSRKLRKVG